MEREGRMDRSAAPRMQPASLFALFLLNQVLKIQNQRCSRLGWLCKGLSNQRFGACELCGLKPLWVCTVLVSRGHPALVAFGGRQWLCRTKFNFFLSLSLFRSKVRSLIVSRRSRCKALQLMQKSSDVLWRHLLGLCMVSSF